MRQFERPNSEKKEDGFDPSRREFLKLLGAAGAAAFFADHPEVAAEGLDHPSRYERDGWWYSAEQMRELYEREYNGPKILENRLIVKRSGVIGRYDGKELAVPQRFVDSTLANIAGLLERKAARYLFRLDAAHGHFFVPAERYRTRYGALAGAAEVEVLARDRMLGILFHNAEHLKLDPNNPEDALFNARRNVLGWYDGRPLEILPSPPGGETKWSVPDLPGAMHNLSPYPKFAAHKTGAFSVWHRGKRVRLDVSLDDPWYY